MKYSCTTFPGLLALCLSLVVGIGLGLGATPASAGPTALASMPLMSLTGSGTVKPNLMLLYDDSGSMAYTYTPDYVNDNTTCRASSTLALGLRECTVGDVPFHTPQFNRQYYNPEMRYKPPVKADQTSYPEQNRSTTNGWTNVTTDGFGLEFKDLRSANAQQTNLVTGFPDLEWCDDAGECRRNVIGYTYPNRVFNSPNAVTGNAYYYKLNVNEYCTNNKLTSCVSTAVNAVAPSTTYGKPAPVRWCDSTALNNCQAKFVGNFKYPRFGDPERPVNWYSTITINDSKSNNTLRIDRVTSASTAGLQEITNGALTVSGGTNTPDERTAVAVALVKSINAKMGLARPFYACVKTASGTAPACANYGITLPTNEMLAVFPISCPRTDNKNGCTVVKEGSRTAEELIVETGTRVTALLQFSGTAGGNTRSVLTNLRFAGQTWFSRGLELGRSASSAQVVTQLVTQIGTGGTVKAYAGGNAITPQCAAAQNTTLCLVGPMSADGTVATIGSINNRNSLAFTAVAAVTDNLPTSVSGVDTGVFTRTDIVSSRATYPRAEGRTDCQGTLCTYDEEMTNFANWYAYYKSRNQMMKTAVGHAFQPLDKDYKVGLVGLQRAANQTDYMGRDEILYPKSFAGGDRVAWYKALYEMNSAGGTPVRLALNEMGNMFANKGIFKQAAGAEVIEFACQQNFTFVTTDGYWNGGSVSDVANNDNKDDPARFCTQDTGCVDTSTQGKPSLADVALYWYNGGSNTVNRDPKKNSLRPELEGADGVVAGTRNKRLHMRTYGLGLGVDGVMTYEPKYDTDREPGGDLDNIIDGVRTGCPWTSDGVYRWPDPVVDKVALSDTYQSRVDDLWHAAINGGGKYFAASDPQQVVTGLNEALNDIRQATGAAASAATSTPNITQEDADIFSSTFTTVKWTGNLTKRVLNPVTGEVKPEVIWSSTWTVGKQVAAASDTRSIWYRDPTSGTRKELAFAGMGADQAWFKDKCSLMTQCANLNSANQAIVNNGATIVGWLRGHQQYANNVILRAYTPPGETEVEPDQPAQPVVLGDIASSKPAYLRGARKSYVAAGYDAYKTAQAGRKPTVFIAANDGMLHAFDAIKGTEMWAYMPRITMKKLYRQASVGYATEHQFTVDGSPELADVQINGAWRTILVAGLNSGGRGYYAIDVTDPDAPTPLWEICADASVCSGALHQPEMGFTFGNPQFGTIKDGTDAEGNAKVRWVTFLTSGYNNIPSADDVAGGSGKGILFVVDVATGQQVLNLGDSDITHASTGLLTTGSGGIGSGTGVADPSGLAKITAITANPNTDPLVTYLYGGDNFGQMWRFDFTGAKVARVRMGSAGVGQPITSRPDVAMCQVDTTAEGADASPTRRVVAFGTGRMLDYTDIKDVSEQSVYVLADSGVPVSDGKWRSADTFSERQFTETVPYNAATPTVPRSNRFKIGGAGVDLGEKAGWFVDFDKNAGERVNLDPKIVSGTLSVVTNLPQSATACNVGGSSYAYHLDVCTGKAVAGDIAGSLLSGDAAAVGFIIVRLPSGALKMVTTTAKGDTITTEVTSATSQDARRTGWRRVRD
ncbi:PilC/PilY family type IV pilus protein [Massilia aurea]|uniref:pilus assembly protein n=1 Tax=Massilia aurea TaxID=373040 RepID=UPI0034631486